MPLYKCKSYDIDGIEQETTITAEDQASARAQLKVLGLTPFSIEESNDSEQNIFYSSGLNLSEQARFSRQMAALLKGGVPLTKALRSLEGQEAWQKRTPLLINLRENVEKGKGFSEALIEIGGTFSPALLSIIRVGETTGKLDYSFRQLADSLEKEIDHRRRLISAIAYPAITALISIGVLAFLMVYLVPTVARMFADVEGQLPWITQIIIGFSNFFRNYWQVLSLAAFIGIIAAHFAFKLDSVKRTWETTELKIPIWGRFRKGMKMEAWSRNTGNLIECGVPLLEAIRVMLENEDSLLLKDALRTAEKNLERGKSFSDSLNLSKFFPVFLIQMIEAGEASGELAPMMESAATELEAENRVVTELFLNILEPLLIVVMGTVVGAIMIGVLLPIYEMNRFM